MSDELSIKIAKSLRKIRKEKKLSQIELAGMAEIHFTYYSQIERAIRNDLSVRILKKITDALGVTLNDVVY